MQVILCGKMKGHYQKRDFSVFFFLFERFRHQNAKIHGKHTIQEY